MVCYVRFVAWDQRRWFYGCFVLYGLALLSKPITVSLPVAFLLMDYWPLRRMGIRRIREKVPLFILALLFGGITFCSQSRTTTIYLPADYGVGKMPLILGYNMSFYLHTFLWPAQLSAYYGYATEKVLWMGTAVTGTLIVLLVTLRRWLGSIGCGLAIFVALIFPALGLISVTPVTVANRYAYLPSVGLYMVLATVLVRIEDRMAHHPCWIRRTVTGSLVIGLVIAVILPMRQYQSRWQDTLGLYRYMLTLAPQSATLHTDVGAELSQLGQSREAISHYEKALHLDPNGVRTHYNLAVELAKSPDRAEEAIRHYEQVLKLDPNHLNACLNLGSVLLARGQLDEAAIRFEKAVAMNKTHPVCHYNLGKVRLIQEQPLQGLEHIRQAVVLEPGFIPAIRDLAWFLATYPDPQMRDPNEALVLAKCLAHNSPQHPNMLTVLAAAHASDGNYAEAVKIAEDARRKAIRIRDHAAVGNLEDHLIAYRNSEPFLEWPRVQLERLTAMHGRHHETN
jgi:tetratricopeptide (TPR) repeat protein